MVRRRLTQAQKASANIKAVKFLPLLITALSIPLTCAADEKFRCGRWIVSSDTTLGELIEKCGEPASRTSRTEDVKMRSGYGGMVKVGESVIETWTYVRPSHAAPMVVTIIDGRIKSIDRKK